MHEFLILSSENQDKDTESGWSVSKLYLHAHYFLYKLDYNSKCNTQEKYPLTSSWEEARLIKGKSSKGEVQRVYEGELAWAS